MLFFGNGKFMCFELFWLFNFLVRGKLIFISLLLLINCVNCGGCWDVWIFVKEEIFLLVLIGV